MTRNGQKHFSLAQELGKRGASIELGHVFCAKKLSKRNRSASREFETAKRKDPLWVLTFIPSRMQMKRPRKRYGKKGNRFQVTILLSGGEMCAVMQSGIRITQIPTPNMAGKSTTFSRERRVVGRRWIISSRCSGRPTAGKGTIIPGPVISSARQPRPSGN